ncbi:MAG: acetate--CoA ligase family protein [Alphaproteobacteria bacterium]
MKKLIREGRAMFRSVAPLLQAKSIAIVGASDRARWPVSIHRNLTGTGAAARLYPINPTRETVWGVRCYPDFTSLPEAPDLALIIIPAERVLPALEDGVARGLKSALVYASGIGEGDNPEFHRRGAALAALCEDSGLVACGPNCMGNISMREKLFLYPNPDFNNATPGGVGAVFQSGGTLQHWCRTGAERGMRFSYMVSSGNELSLDAADYVNFLVDDPHTTLIILMLEGVRRPEAFKEAARRALIAGKPILAVKAGQSEQSRAAAQSHTGAIAGDYDVFAALCERYGIVLCPSLDDMTETALAFQAGRLPTGDRMAFMTNSGGVVDLLYDYAEREGARLGRFAPATRKALKDLVGPDMPIRNPMDCGQAGFASMENYMRICEAVCADPGIDMLAFEARTPRTEGEKDVAPFRALADRVAAPVFAFSRMEYQVSEYGQVFQEQTRIPHLQSMPETLRAMKALAFYAARAGRKIPKLPRPGGTAQAVSPRRLTGTLRRAGLPPPKTRLTESASAAANAARRIGFPVALKIVSPEVSHKTEVGGVRLNLRNAAEVRAAAAELARALRKHAPGAAIDGYLVQEMVAGVEIILGVRDDPLYGPVLVMGAGGVLVELVKDTAFRMLPVGRRDARAMIDELVVAKLLRGYRGGPPADIDALIDAVCGLSRLFLDHRPFIADLEINPLIVREAGRGVRAVDICPVYRDSTTEK